jgi:hypothetical protein
MKCWISCFGGGSREHSNMGRRAGTDRHYVVRSILETDSQGRGARNED